MPAPAVPSTPAFLLERTFDATPQAVWAAWTQAERFTKWWSPSPGRDAIVHEADVRPGGRLRLTMVVPEALPFAGTDTFPVNATFVTVRPPHELALDVDEDDAVEPPSRIRVTFEDLGGRTRMTFEKLGAHGAEETAGLQEGWGACFDKLRDQLESNTPE